jgi:hypothetical protein
VDEAGHLESRSNSTSDGEPPVVPARDVRRVYSTPVIALLGRGLQISTVIERYTEAMELLQW